MRGCWGRVLIETLWNVNEDEKARVCDDANVLIETLWNVNLVFKLTKYDGLSFNRNIVECKLDDLEAIDFMLEGFNRNIVECKFSRSRGLNFFRLRFNRNIVECKLISNDAGAGMEVTF